MLNRTVAPSHSSSYQIEFPKVTQHTLDNGIPLYVLNEGTQPVVKLEVMFPTGGTYYEKKTATSLLTLKMLREGTASFSSNHLSNHFAQYGAFLELNPSFDVPSISLYCLSKHLDVLLPCLVEMIFSPVFPENELKRIRQIEIQQLRLQNERTNIEASKKFRNLLFGNDHAYGKIITEGDLINCQQDDLKLFHQDNLANIELIASGAVSIANIGTINHIFKQFSHRSGANNTGTIFVPQTDTTSLIKEDKSSALQSSIRLGNLTVNKTHQDYIPLLITTHILGGYFGSRLMKNIREDKGYTYGIYSSIVALRHNSYMVIGTDVKKEFLEDTVHEINKELDTLSSVLVGEHELHTVKNHMIGHFQSKLSSAFSLAEKFKNIHIHDLSYSYYQKYLSTIEHITPEQIQEMAKKYLSSSFMKTVLIG
ncbi:insulinase family protein [Fulvivirga ulvae]|uniref:M16 family metallopeptidase n=1 Tax=Fulvivirga ulvae TaxID=2904245 RepID=UPI001F2F4DAE|nr:pitrilysin family protein [Fulvivirga ulvae]UII33545.1 insulinase family protein [Fulvivirga ulvae]